MLKLCKPLHFDLPLSTLPGYFLLSLPPIVNYSIYMDVRSWLGKLPHNSICHECDRRWKFNWKQVPLHFQRYSSRYFCGSIILILSLFALFANIEICLYHRFSKNKPILSLSVASIFYQLANLMVYVPCAFTSCPFYSTGLLQLLATPNACYNVLLLCFVHLSMERMLVFYSDSLHRRFQRNSVSSVVLFTMCSWNHFTRTYD